MAKVSKNQPLIPSVLDRLLDDDPSAPHDTQKTRTQVLRELRASVRRDLENLLNTRINWSTWPEHLTELETSLANYGLPDFSSSSMGSADQREAFRELIEDTLRRYETRFKTVKVTLLDNSEPLDRTLRLRIDALLHADPDPEPIAFHSLMEPVSQSVQIKESTT
jgi:type VI secretion system protein ImpF